MIRLGTGAFSLALLLPALALRSLTREVEEVAAGDTLVYASGDRSGLPVDVAALAPGTAVQAFPQGKSDNERNLVELVRLAGDLPMGLVAYSAICTHLGCTVLPQLRPRATSSARVTAASSIPRRAAVVHGPAEPPPPCAAHRGFAGRAVGPPVDSRGQSDPCDGSRHTQAGSCRMTDPVSTDTPEAASAPAADVPPRSAGWRWLDERLGLGALYRKYGRKAFPVHSTFFLGEMALFAFVILVLTGIYLGFMYVPSNAEVTVDGETLPEAYASVRLIESIPVANLFRNIHHWAAHLMVASVLLHLLRIFFTGTYRKPREINWIIGIVAPRL